MLSMVAGEHHSQFCTCNVKSTRANFQKSYVCEVAKTF